MSDRAKQSAGGSAPGTRRTRTHIGPWQLGRTLGRGSSGRVRLAKHADTGQLAAVKIVPKTLVESTYGIEREVIIMKLIEHPNVMGLYDVWENKGELYLVLEYIEGGELFDYLVRRGRLSEREAVYYFRQICLGVRYCHAFNICHRDLKPENLLLDRHRNIKIADFGMAALETQDRMLETSCGSPHYASPEIVAGNTYHGAPSDIWSCGVILFALVTGHLPFDDDNIRVLLRKVQAGRYSIPSFVGPEARDLISRMLRVNPEDRISMDSILAHPLLTKYTFKNSAVPQPPALDASRPVSSIGDIDQEILRNLKILWHHTEEDQIVQRLLAPEPNPEKTFYCLLLKYRQAHRRPQQPQGISSSMSRSASRNSIRSIRSSRSKTMGSSRSLRTISRQRVSMASIHSRYVAERPAPKAPKRKQGESSGKPVQNDPARQTEQTEPAEPAEHRHSKEYAQAAQATQTAKTAQAPTLDPAASRIDAHSSFAQLIDQAFSQRAVSATEPRTLLMDERRTVSDGELLPMIFEEDRLGDSTAKVRRKPVGAGVTNTTTTAPSPYTSGGSAKTGPILRPVSMVDELTPAKRNSRASAVSLTKPGAGPTAITTTAPANATSAVPDLPEDRAPHSPELTRRRSKRVAEFALSTPVLGSPPVIEQPRRPLSGVSPNIYPAQEQKQKVSILRRFTPKRHRDQQPPQPAEATAAAIVVPPVQAEETKQNWFFKMLNLGGQSGAPRVLYSSTDVAHLRTVISRVLDKWSRYGLVFEGSGSTVTATITSRNSFKLRMSRFTIRVQPIEPRRSRGAGSSVVCTQVRGAQSSYLRFVGELERVLLDMDLLVRDRANNGIAITV